jgi:hypothetical protein
MPIKSICNKSFCYDGTKMYFLLSEFVKFLSLSNPIHCSDWGYAQIIFPAGFASQEGGVSIRMLFEFDENAYVLL